MSDLPLDGVRVVDLTRILAGPFATMTLGDLGADVIKIERPGRGDETRHWGPPFHRGTATYFLAVNRNKRSMTLDLKQQSGVEVLWRLLEGADVLVSNFRPGVMDRLGFSRAAVSRRCPGVVYSLINGYGAEGPFADRSSYDLVIQAESGLMDLTGEATGVATKVGVSIADETAGMLLVQGILAALLARERDGVGRLVEIALHDAMLSTFTFQAQAYLTAGVRPRRLGNSHPSLVPYRPFATADGEIVVGVASDQLWRRFCNAVGLEQLCADSRFATNAQRVGCREQLEALIGEHLSTTTTAEWLSRLLAAGVPCGRVRTADEAIDGPEVAARGLLLECPVGGYRMVGQPVRLDGEAAPLRLEPPALGAHTRAVLDEIGYAANDVRELAANGVI